MSINLKTDQYKLFNLNYRKKYFKNKPKYLVFTSFQFQKEKRKSVVQKKIFEKIMAKNFPNLAKDINPEIQKAQ